MTTTWRADGAAAIPLAVWTAISPQPIIPIPSCSGTSPSVECWRAPLDHADGWPIDAPWTRPYDPRRRRPRAAPIRPGGRCDGIEGMRARRLWITAPFEIALQEHDLPG